MSTRKRRPSRQRRRSAGRGFRRSAAQVFGAFASVVALLVAVTTLADWLGSKFDDAPPPPQVDAQVERVTLRDQAVSLEEYADSIGRSVRGLSRDARRELGWVYNVRVRLKGGVNERFPLVWTLHRAKTGERLKDPLYNQPAEVTFTPRSRNQARTWPIWVPYPSRPGTYFLRTTLTDAKDQPVDEQDSRPIPLPTIPD